MNARRFAFFLFALAVVCAGFGTFATADPLPGERLKFRQWPLNNGLLPEPVNIAGALFPGHDELSTAIPVDGPNFYSGTYMADDFADKFDSPVVHVRWWGSYLNQSLPTNAVGVRRFLISFENDVPADPNNPFSHPGTERFNQVVTLGPLAPGSGTFTSKLLPTPVIPGAAPPPEALFEYNAELNLGKEFPEKANNVYWLKIVALVDPAADGPLQWGWHNRDWSIPDFFASAPPAVSPGEGIVGGVVIPGTPPTTLPVYHFQDDAVTGPVRITFTPTMPNMPLVEQDAWSPTHYTIPFDGPDGIQQFSKDLAFELYTTVPEPATCVLLAAGFIAVAGRARRSR